MKTRRNRRSVIRQGNSIAELTAGDEVCDQRYGEQAEYPVAKE
jgi:hypothetical protein